MTRHIFRTFAILFGWLLVVSDTLVPDSQWNWISAAYAARNLSPSEINLQTIAGRGDFARFLYYSINGPTSGYTVTGPSDGFTGLINNITAGVGKRLEAEGYRGCGSIPETGSITKDIQTKEGSVVVTMNFARGTMTVPSHYAKYGGTVFGKRIEILRAGGKFMAIELQCDTDSNIRTGYIVTAGSQLGTRNFEVYFQNNLNTRAGHVDLMQTSSDSDAEKVAVRFQTGDGDNYEMWIIRTTNGAPQGIGGAFFGLKGSASFEKAMVNAVLSDSLTDTTTITSAVEKDCIDFSNDVASSSTGCSAVTEPAGLIQYGSKDLNWTIAGTAEASITSF